MLARRVANELRASGARSSQHVPKHTITCKGFLLLGAVGNVRLVLTSHAWRKQQCHSGFRHLRQRFLRLLELLGRRLDSLNVLCAVAPQRGFRFSEGLTETDGRAEVESKYIAWIVVVDHTARFNEHGCRFGHRICAESFVSFDINVE